VCIVDTIVKISGGVESVVLGSPEGRHRLSTCDHEKLHEIQSTTRADQESIVIYLDTAFTFTIATKNLRI
jgi:hypothetical protein